MRVIADLHGGDLENEKAIFEFEEIKEKVTQDVRGFSFCFFLVLSSSPLASAKPDSRGHTE
jgi:hypothetical protein